MCPFELHPLKMASSLLTLNEVAKGRAQIVIGAGGGTATAMGAKPVRVVRAVRECDEILRLAATGQPVRYKGELFEVKWYNPSWVRSTPPDIYIGANGPQMLKAAPRYADAIMVSDFVVDHVRRAQDALGVQLAIENVAAPLRWPDDELPEAAFVAEVLERADVGLLLDVANLHANLVNGTCEAASADAYLDRLPLDRIAYLHAAGGARHGAWWRDTHAHPIGDGARHQQRLHGVAHAIVRTAFQALAGVLGGTQSLHTNSMDETLALPSEKAVKIALRTQQIIAYETGVTNTIDPLAGSYFIESLTTAMEEEAERYFEKIDALGGVIPAIEAGFFQREIAEAAYRYQQELDRKEKIIVGVNDFVEEGETIEIPILQISPEVERMQRRRLAEVRSSRDTVAVERSLEALRRSSAEGATSSPTCWPAPGPT